jgi:uncharacterized membrane protein YfcA
MSAKWIKPLFVIAGLYDGLLGIAFLFFHGPIYQKFGVEPPNHAGYVHFGALVLLIFALMFFRIARNPVANRELILYGVGLKAAYSGTVFWHWFTGSMPALWLPWAWADLVFLLLFLAAWKSLGQAPSAAPR